MAPEVHRIPLGGGRWADIRDVRTLKHRDKRYFSEITGDAFTTDKGGGVGKGIAAGIDAAICLLVVGWNVTSDTGSPLLLPKEQPDVLDDLDLEASDALCNAASAVVQAFNGRDVTPKDPDPDSPTEPSST